MASKTSLEDAVTELMDSPGGELLSSIRIHLRKRAFTLFGLFLAGLIAGFPIAKNIIKWIIDEQRLPDDVNVIVTSPVEFIMLQIQLSASLGLFLAFTFLITEASLRGVNHPVVKARVAELDVKVPKPSITMILSVASSIALALLGIIYAWELLTPMLLEYLSTDAQEAGLSTQWKLGAYVGFVLNLAIASAIGFQAPVVTMLALRVGMVDPKTITMYRKHIWFCSFLVGAMFSPPDPLSLFLVALPIILLFELSLIIDRLLPKR
jgi:sec-independent protein translocase protein TatC